MQPPTPDDADWLRRLLDAESVIVLAFDGDLIRHAHSVRDAAAADGVANLAAAIVAAMIEGDASKRTRTRRGARNGRPLKEGKA